MQIDPISITVEGTQDSAASAICGIIDEALTEKGFTNVAVTNLIGEPVSSSDSNTVLDQIKLNRPELFNTPITIQNTTYEGEDTDSDGEEENVSSEQDLMVEAALEAEGS